MRGGFSRQFGQTAPAISAGTAAATGIPQQSGGNAVQGRGIVFQYQTPNVATLNHGASSGAQNIQFDNNSTFLWLRATFSCDISAAEFTVSSQPVPLITLNITDTGNGMSFMNGPIPVYEIAGLSGSLPYILPTPQFIQPNASYSFQFANYDAAVNYTNVRYQLHGYRIFATDMSTVRAILQQGF